MPRRPGLLFFVLLALAGSFPTSGQQPAAGAGRETRTDVYGDPLPDGAIARVGTVRFRASASIKAIAFSADGRFVAYGSEDGFVHVDQASDGRPLFDLHLTGDRHKPVTELAFSPDGRTLAAGGYSSARISLLDLATGKVRLALRNTAKGQESWGTIRQGPGFAFTPDCRTLVVGGKDGALHLWDQATGTELAAMTRTSEPVLSLTLTADGLIALTAHQSGELHLWDIKNRKHLRKLAGSAKYPHFTALAPDGKTLALSTSTTQLELWEPDGRKRHQIRTTSPVAGLSFTPDGATFLVADWKGNVERWDTRTGVKRSSLNCAGISLSVEVTDKEKWSVPLAWFRGDGKAMAWADDGTIRQWDLSSEQETPRFSLFRHGVSWAGFSSDGLRLRVGGWNGEVGVWDSITGKPLASLGKPNQNWAMYYEPTPDRKKVVAITIGNINATPPDTDAGRIFLWEPDAGRGLVPLPEQVKLVSSAALTPDHRFVVALEAGGRIGVHDAATGRPVRSFRGTSELGLTLSPDGALVVTTDMDGIRLYDFKAGRLLRELHEPPGTSCIAFSPDGRIFASGHWDIGLGYKTPEDNVICLRETKSDRLLRRIPTLDYTVRTLVFSADGRLIASGGQDRVVRVWEVSSGQLRRRYDGHRDSVRSVDFSPDCQRLASASLDGTALIWRVFDSAPADRPAADLEALWTDLAKDGVTAHRAMGALIAAKKAAIFLGQRLKPATTPAGEQLKVWLADLGSPAYKTREAAQKELARVGDTIEPELRRALEAATDGEVRRRLTLVLENIPRQETRPDHLRELRAIEVLEHVGNAEARRLLADLEKGAPEARTTREARASLARLQRTE
jgi:WD40 repeat protein